MDQRQVLNMSQSDRLQHLIRRRSNANTTLMSLPGELRNQIYDHVLHSEVIDASQAIQIDLDTLKTMLFGPSLGRVCHQLRAETRAILPHCDKVEICKYDSSGRTFCPVSLDAMGYVLQRATWFRAIRTRDTETARKSVKVCNDELDLDFCGTVSFGSKSNIRPLWFVASLRPAGG